MSFSSFLGVQASAILAMSEFLIIQLLNYLVCLSLFKCLSVARFVCFLFFCLAIAILVLAFCQQVPRYLQLFTKLRLFTFICCTFSFPFICITFVFLALSCKPALFQCRLVQNYYYYYLILFIFFFLNHVPVELYHLHISAQYIFLPTMPTSIPSISAFLMIISVYTLKNKGIGYILV